jgi:hypothetical protein
MLGKLHDTDDTESDAESKDGKRTTIACGLPRRQLMRNILHSLTGPSSRRIKWKLNAFLRAHEFLAILSDRLASGNLARFAQTFFYKDGTLAEAGWACARVVEPTPFAKRAGSNASNMIHGKPAAMFGDDPSAHLFDLAAHHNKHRLLALRLPVLEVWLEHCAKLSLQRSLYYSDEGSWTPTRKPKRDQEVLARWVHWHAEFFGRLAHGKIEGFMVNAETRERAERCWWYTKDAMDMATGQGSKDTMC